jgi:hypothetical protein
MSCERYWREGIVLVERGLDDPHRDGCEACTRAHASRQELIEALPLIGASHTGDPHWQAKVWQRIDGGRARTPWRWRWRWQLAGALTVACAVVLWIGLGRVRPGEVRPWIDGPPRVASLAQIEIISGGVPMRSRTGDADIDDAHVDDRLRVTVGESSDVWIYRDGRPVLRCRARQVSDGCAPAAHGMIVEMVLSIPGTYQMIVTAAPVAWPPRGRLDEDRGALERAGASYREKTVQVR